MSAVSQLADYQTHQLDISAEAENFRHSLDRLRKQPSHASTLALAEASRRMLYALEQLCWHMGPRDPAVRSRYDQARQLFDDALAQESPTLQASQDAERVQTLFKNIGQRRKEILRYLEDS